jgi:hypothetical protein
LLAAFLDVLLSVLPSPSQRIFLLVHRVAWPRCRPVLLQVVEIENKHKAHDLVAKDAAVKVKEAEAALLKFDELKRQAQVRQPFRLCIALRV